MTCGSCGISNQSFVCLTDEYRSVKLFLDQCLQGQRFTELLQCVLWSCDLCSIQALVQARYRCILKWLQLPSFLYTVFCGVNCTPGSVFESYTHMYGCIWRCAHAPDATCRCFIYVFYIKIKSHITYFGLFSWLCHFTFKSHTHTHTHTFGGLRLSPNSIY